MFIFWICWLFYTYSMVCLPSFFKHGFSVNLKSIVVRYRLLIQCLCLPPYVQLKMMMSLQTAIVYLEIYTIVWYKSSSLLIKENTNILILQILQFIKINQQKRSLKDKITLKCLLTCGKIKQKCIQHMTLKLTWEIL